MSVHTEQHKETKAQRIERLKREKNPWQCLDEILRFAKEGHEAIPKEWLDLYFRWWGVYTQGDGQGVLGKDVPHFMVRIRIPNGLLRSHQLRTVADLAEKYGRGIGDLTVRQNIQLHWVRIEDMPDIFSNLFRVGLTTMASCGDDTRNITGCPLAGVDRDEVYDASGLVEEATNQLIGRADTYNLPRKYKICITGCRVWCSYPEINDVGLTATERWRDGQKEIGFSLRVGGGLSTEPHFAVPLDAFVYPHQVPSVVEGITQLFHDSDVLRENRAKARLKFLFLEHGWTAERFQAELERRIGFQLEPGVPEEAPDHAYRDHVGIHPQKQEDYYYAGFSILRGRLTAAEMRLAADLADQYGDGQLRTTNMQNLVVLNLPKRHVDAVVRQVDGTGLKLEASPFWRGTIACTGTEFCKVAIAETKSFARWLVEELDERLPGFDRHIKINVNGCPNSCGQLWIADIGLQGCKTKVEERLLDAFDFLLGGNVGKGATFTRRVGFRTLAGKVPDAIERLLWAYLNLRLNGEKFHAFCQRHSDEQLRTFLAGGKTAAVAAPAAPSRPPHGVEG
jgi:sulfite reductase (ferredoxin)